MPKNHESRTIDTNGTDHTPEPTHTTAEMAALLDITPHTLRTWVKAGCPAAGGGRVPYLFTPAAVLAWMTATGRTGQVGITLATRTGNPELVEARRRKENALADLAELRLERLRAGLVSAEWVRKDWAKMKARAEAVVREEYGAAVPDLVGKDAATIQTILEQRTHAILTRLSTPDPADDHADGGEDDTR